MSRPLPQNLNQSRSQISSAFNANLAATPFTGVVSTSVLLWLVANEAVLGVPAYYTIANDANAGTTVQINKAGVYAVELGVAVIAAATVLVLGISQDATNLTNNLVIADVGALDASGLITIVDADVTFFKFTTTVIVSPEQEAAGSIVRFHASAANVAPAAMLLAATSYYRVRRLLDNNI